MKKTAQHDAGEFRFPVEVWKSASVDDGSGGQSTTFAKSFIIFCKIENKTGSEPYGDSSSGRIRTFQKFMFTTWFRPDLSQTDQLRFEGNKFNIRQLNNLDLRNKYIQIECDSGVEQ